MVCVAKTKIIEFRGCAQRPVISIFGPVKSLVVQKGYTKLNCQNNRLLIRALRIRCRNCS